jgi:hypothetical protein
VSTCGGGGDILTSSQKPSLLLRVAQGPVLGGLFESFASIQDWYSESVFLLLYLHPAHLLPFVSCSLKLMEPIHLVVSHFTWIMKYVYSFCSWFLVVCNASHRQWYRFGTTFFIVSVLLFDEKSEIFIHLIIWFETLFLPSHRPVCNNYTIRRFISYWKLLHFT